MIAFQEIISNIYFWVFASCLFGFLLSIRMYPVIIYTVRAKNLMDEPGDRKIHAAKTPALGGVGLFASFTLSLILSGVSIGLNRPDLIRLLSILAATMILLFLGMKDDLIAISPKKKLLGQLIAAAIVIFVSDVRISSLEGLLGIGELPYTFSVMFTIFVFVLVVNSYNLIDGIDGLAGSIALLASVLFGTFFLLNENYLMAVVSFILIGTVIGFLKYNLSDTRKLFMGDSGSLFLGFLLAFQGISFLSLNGTSEAIINVKNAPILLLTVLSFPLLDTLRVFMIRAKEGRSPFSPDRNHIHHRLLDLGLSHKQSTLFITLSNLVLVGLTFLISDLNINIQLVLCIVLGIILYLSPFLKMFEKSKVVNSVNGNLEIVQKTTEIIKLNDAFDKPITSVTNKNEPVEMENEGVMFKGSNAVKPIHSTIRKSIRNKKLQNEKRTKKKVLHSK